MFKEQDEPTARMAIQKLRQSDSTRPSVDDTLHRLDDVMERLGGETTLGRVKTTIDRSKSVAAKISEEIECHDHAGHPHQGLGNRSSPCAKVCNFDSQAAAMRIVPAIKMHNDFE